MLAPYIATNTPHAEIAHRMEAGLKEVVQKWEGLKKVVSNHIAFVPVTPVLAKIQQI